MANAVRFLRDVGPMMFFYRADLFAANGLTIPSTWDQYAATALALRNRSSFLDALDRTQSTAVADLQKSGFSIKK